MTQDSQPSSIYTDGSYIEKSGGNWHLDDAPFKARQVLKMMRKHAEFASDTICEIGCGAGGILSQLQESLPPSTRFTGYEISPQALEIGAQFANDRCQFVLGDAFQDGLTFDMALVMDVVEHVEDCFSFLRNVKGKARAKIYHIPIDAHVSAILRGRNSWESVGHIHIFTIETALKSIEYSGQRVVDWFLTDGGLASPYCLQNRLANILRYPIGLVSRKWCSRLLGGYSMLILAE